MTLFLLRRLGATTLVFVLVTIVVFSLTYFIPGDPAVTIAGEFATEEQIAHTRERLGLDQPLLVQYTEWLGSVLRGDLGTSLYGNQSVSSAVARRLPATFSLTLGAAFIAILLSFPAGILAATHRGRAADHGLTFFASLGVAMPSFWVGLLLILVFSLRLGWLPALGYTPLGEGLWPWMRHLILPSGALAFLAVAEMSRQLRGAMVDVLQRDYIRTAVAKGLPRTVVVLKHGLKNAALPVVTLFGVHIGFMLSGAAIVEMVFGIPGLGQLAIRSVTERDIPMVQGVVVVSALVVMAANLLVDLTYGYLDPRLRVRRS